MYMKKLIFISLCTVILPLYAAKPVTDYVDWARKIADSEMKRNPELWMGDFVNEPKWNYTHGLMAASYIKLFYQTSDTAYYRYVKTFADQFISASGEIKTYHPDEYNIDKLNGGNFLFDMFTITLDPKYVSAIRLLRSQLYTHPRVEERAFWHKKVYPHQVWLDGLYMGAPFYTRFAAIFDQPIEVFDDVITQFRVADKHTFDPKTGLNYHGWDESRLERWANKTTGQSPNFWSRSIGWYMMAVVDVLEYLPVNHPDRPYMIKLLNRLSASVIKYQDKRTGMWWQVTNMPHKSGNYLESSGTAMFSYALSKAVNNGYLPAKKFKKPAIKAFDGLIKHSVVMNADSTYSVTKACSVAGLGGTPYRDGSYQYYISEPVRSDDPKVLGPFILAAIELSKMK